MCGVWFEQPLTLSLSLSLSPRRRNCCRFGGTSPLSRCSFRQLHADLHGVLVCAVCSELIVQERRWLRSGSAGTFVGVLSLSLSPPRRNCRRFGGSFFLSRCSFRQLHADLHGVLVCAVCSELIVQERRWLRSGSAGTFVGVLSLSLGLQWRKRRRRRRSAVSIAHCHSGKQRVEKHGSVAFATSAS